MRLRNAGCARCLRDRRRRAPARGRVRGALPSSSPPWPGWPAGLDDVGISGYPESHHFISDETTIEAMFEKEPMATYIVSQICFDADVIRT